VCALDAARVVGLRLEARIAALEARVQRLERQARRADESDRNLVRTIATVAGGHVFTTADLWRHRAVDPRLQDLSRRALGARLRALRDRSFDGLVLRLVKRSHGLRWWTVAVTDDRHADPGQAPPDAAE
jgi:hypothetical protein